MISSQTCWPLDQRGGPAVKITKLIIKYNYPIIVFLNSIIRTYICIFRFLLNPKERRALYQPSYKNSSYSTTSDLWTRFQCISYSSKCRYRLPTNHKFKDTPKSILKYAFLYLISREKFEPRPGFETRTSNHGPGSNFSLEIKF